MSRQFVESPICNDTRPCFGSHLSYGGFRRCRVLTEGYPKDGECPFCKEREADVPNSDLRRLIGENDIYYKQIALHLGVSRQRLCEMMGAPLSERCRKRIKKAVMELVEEKQKYVQ